MPLESHNHDGGSYFVIPHEHNLRWIMMFYALPKEMFEKLPEYRQMPRNLRAFRQAEKYSDMLMSDQFLEVVWNLYAWIVWFCLRVPGRNGEYRPLPGAWHHYSEDFPIWRLTYTTPSAVKKRINKIAAAYTDFISEEYSDFLDSHTR